MTVALVDERTLHLEVGAVELDKLKFGVYEVSTRMSMRKTLEVDNNVRRNRPHVWLKC